MEQLKDSLAEDLRLTNLIQIPLKNKRIDPSCPPWSQVSSDLTTGNWREERLILGFCPKFWKADCSGCWKKCHCLTMWISWFPIKKTTLSSEELWYQIKQWICKRKQQICHLKIDGICWQPPWVRTQVMHTANPADGQNCKPLTKRGAADIEKI